MHKSELNTADKHNSVNLLYFQNIHYFVALLSNFPRRGEDRVVSVVVLIRIKLLPLVRQLVCKHDIMLLFVVDKQPASSRETTGRERQDVWDTWSRS